MNRGEANEPEGDMKPNTSGDSKRDFSKIAAPMTNHAASSPTSRWRRSVRGRVRPLLAGALVGALLGAGTVGWQTDTLPFSEGERCWGSLTEQDLEDLPLGDEAIDIEEISPSVGYGRCQLRGEDEDSSTVTIRLHQPVNEVSGPEARTNWPVDFLTADMAPLGSQLTGMASPHDAWLALPQSCVETDEYETPWIVDVQSGLERFSTKNEDMGDMQDTLARVVVRATNGVMDKLGCSGRFSEPGELPAPSKSEKRQPVKLCGLDDFTLPATMRGTADEGWASPDEGPVRICELGGDRLGTKLVTITDPLLVPLLNALVRQPGGEFKGANGRGSGSDSEAAFVSDCQSGEVGFLAQRKDETYSDLPTDMRGMLARYADAQAESVGCAPPRMETASGGD